MPSMLTMDNSTKTGCHDNAISAQFDNINFFEAKTFVDAYLSKTYYNNISIPGKPCNSRNTSISCHSYNNHRHYVAQGMRHTIQ